MQTDIKPKNPIKVLSNKNLEGSKEEEEQKEESAEHDDLDVFKHGKTNKRQFRLSVVGTFNSNSPIK